MDLDELTLGDYYHMKDYYQLKVALAMISFTLMSLNWWVEGENKEVEAAVEWQLDSIWHQLMTSISKAFWCGYSPNVKVFDEHGSKDYLYIKELKDLSPFKCLVALDKKDQSFDGFIQKGGTYTVNKITGHSVVSEAKHVDPVKVDSEYAFWYPFMMKNNNYEGSKLMKGAYYPWFFSQVIHLYENKYYDRFSSPIAIGHAPNNIIESESEDGVEQRMHGQDLMASILRELRNNSSVSLPSLRDEDGNLIWDIKYLESQMRGYDFETYLNRLDSEMARATFVPNLLFDAGKKGSYKLGEVHKDTFLMLLNALMSDIKVYIDKYISKQFVQYNFSPTYTGRGVEVPRFNFERQGTISTPIIADLIKEMTKIGRLDVDVEDIARITGVPLKEGDPQDLQPDYSGMNDQKGGDKKDDKDSDKEENRKPSNIIINNLDKDNSFDKDTIFVNRVDVLEKKLDKIIAQKDIEKDEKRYSPEALMVRDNFYNNVLETTSAQVGRITTWMQQNDKKNWSNAKLGYRAKLDKIFEEALGEDYKGVYAGAQKITTAVISKGKGSIGEMRGLLWDTLIEYYLTVAYKYKPELALGMAGKIDKLISKMDV